MCTILSCCYFYNPYDSTQSFRLSNTFFSRFGTALQAYGGTSALSALTVCSRSVCGRTLGERKPCVSTVRTRTRYSVECDFTRQRRYTVHAAHGLPYSTTYKCVFERARVYVLYVYISIYVYIYMYVHYFPIAENLSCHVWAISKLNELKNRKYITWEKIYRIYQTRCFAFRFVYFHSTWTDRCKSSHRRTIHTRTTRPCRTIQPMEGRLCWCNCNSKVCSNSEISTGVGV